ncbi:tyrosine-type recombinase/integrase [Rhodococcus opacus]
MSGARDEDATPAIRAAASPVSSGANPHSPVRVTSGVATRIPAVCSIFTIADSTGGTDRTAAPGNVSSSGDSASAVRKISRPRAAAGLCVRRRRHRSSWLPTLHRCCIVCIMTHEGALPGAAHLVLASNVAHSGPESAVFEAMLEGWASQQRTWFLKSATIDSRTRLIRRIAKFVNEYPWRWEAADVEAFIDSRRNQPKPIVVSSARLYETTVRMFLEYLTDPLYSWVEICMERFGAAPAQVLHAANTIVDVSEYEGDPRRRPLAYDEIQALFDVADGRAELIRSRRRKGARAAMRDAALLKTVYAFGLRRSEAAGLDLADLRHNPKAPAFGRCGAVFVRWGDSPHGGALKPRTVLTLSEMDWIVGVLEHWLTEIRPGFGVGAHPALWVTERADRILPRRIDEIFATARDAAGLDPALNLNCLRHSYITHLTEFDYPEKFVSTQAGHSIPPQRRSQPACSPNTATGCDSDRCPDTELLE